jgi:hypothetical protein
MSVTGPGDNVDATTHSAVLTPERDQADAFDLQASLRDSSLWSPAPLRLDELLTQVAIYTAHAIPRADCAAVTSLRVDRDDNTIEVLAASAPFVSEIDEIQDVMLKEQTGEVNLLRRLMLARRFGEAGSVAELTLSLATPGLGRGNWARFPPVTQRRHRVRRPSTGGSASADRPLQHRADVVAIGSGPRLR